MQLLFVANRMDQLPAVSNWRRGPGQWLMGLVGIILVLCGAVIGGAMILWGAISMSEGHTAAILLVIPGVLLGLKCLWTLRLMPSVFIDHLRVEITETHVICQGKVVGSSIDFVEPLCNYECVLRRRGERDAVRFHVSVTGGHHDEDHYYLVELKHEDDSKTILLSSYLQAPSQIEDWKHYANLFNLPGREIHEDGRETELSAEHVNKPLAERVSPFSPDEDRLQATVPEQMEVKSHEEETAIDLPKRRYSFVKDDVLPIVFGVVILPILPFLLWHLVQRRSYRDRLWFHGERMCLLELREKEKVTVIDCSLDEIEDLRRGQGLTLRVGNHEHEIGVRLTDEEAQWLGDYLKNKVRGMRTSDRINL